MFKMKIIYCCECCGAVFDAEKDKSKLHEEYWHHENNHCSVESFNSKKITAKTGVKE